MIDELTICICTRNRPEDLALALQSVNAARPPVAAIVVADDSTDDRTLNLVTDRHPHVSYVPGPRRGLGANRNTALSRVRTSHVAFIDDDARLNPEFTGIWREALAALPAPRARIIVTGGERQGELVIHPKAPTFLGHQSRIYLPGEELRTIVINSAVFPRDLFDEVKFDEQLIYGSDEVDIAMHAVGLGYRIVGVPALVNDHFPSPVNREYYAGHADAARLYVMMKRYARVERSFAKAGLFAVIGPAHLMGHAVRRGGLPGIRAAARTIGQARRMLLGSRRGVSSHATDPVATTSR